LWSTAMRSIAVSGRCRSSVGWMASTRDSSGQTRHSAAGSPQGIDDIQSSAFCSKLDRQRLNIRRSRIEVLSSKAPHKPTRRCNPSVLWIECLNDRRNLRCLSWAVSLRNPIAFEAFLKSRPPKTVK
jgi:hypothetical protein